MVVGKGEEISLCVCVWGGGGGRWTLRIKCSENEQCFIVSVSFMD